MSRTSSKKRYERHAEQSVLARRPEPRLLYGRYEVLPRTDGQWIVFRHDSSLKDSLAFLGDSKERCILIAQRLYAQDPSEGEITR